MSRFIATGCLLSFISVASLLPAQGALVEVEFRTSTINACGTLNEEDACVIAVTPVAYGTAIDGFVTTDADILGVRNWSLMFNLNSREVNPFNVAPPFGSNLSPPNPVFIDLNRALEVDSWMTTPGETSWVGLVGSTSPAPDWLSAMDGPFTAFGDESDDGPQDMFHFTRLTFQPGVEGTVSGEIVVAGATGPEYFPFSFTVPEPSAILLVCLGGVCALGLRNRIN